jgi:hypothetical protein
MAVVDLAPRPIHRGPLAYRRRLRTLGPFAGLVVPAVALATSAALKPAVSCEGACLSQVTASWILPALAFPTTVLWGIPLQDGAVRYAGAAVTSVLFWLALGWLAARRATRSPVASWRNWWTEFAWVLGSVWLGTGVGLWILAQRYGEGVFGL